MQSGTGNRLNQIELTVAMQDLTLNADVVDIPVRNECIYEATRIHQYRLKEVGDHLGLYYSTISAVAKRVAESDIPRKKT